jgi:hypothetical protein
LTALGVPCSSPASTLPHPAGPLFPILFPTLTLPWLTPSCVLAVPLPTALAFSLRESWPTPRAGALGRCPGPLPWHGTLMGVAETSVYHPGRLKADSL